MNREILIANYAIMVVSESGLVEFVIQSGIPIDNCVLRCDKNRRG